MSACKIGCRKEGCRSNSNTHKTKDPTATPSGHVLADSGCEMLDTEDPMIASFANPRPPGRNPGGLRGRLKRLLRNLIPCFLSSRISTFSDLHFRLPRLRRISNNSVFLSLHLMQASSLPRRFKSFNPSGLDWRCPH